MQDFDLVQKAYDELVASGDIIIIPAGPNQDQTIDEQKAYMTRRAAYYLYQRNPQYGLLSKTTGTNVQGLSTDIVIKPNGDYYDIATDVDAVGGRRVKAVNGGLMNDSTLAPKWVQPTKKLAGLNGVTPPIPPVDDINVKLDAIIKTLASIMTNQIAMGNLLENYHTEEMTVIQEIYYKPETHPDYTGKLGLNMTFSAKK